MALNGKLVDSTRREFNIAASAIGQILGVAAGNGLVCHAHNSGRGGILLQTTTAAAATGMPFRLHVDVSELACHTVHAVPKASVEHQAAADARAERVHRHVISVAAR